MKQPILFFLLVSLIGYITPVCAQSVGQKESIQLYLEANGQSSMLKWPDPFETPTSYELYRRYEVFEPWSFVTTIDVNSTSYPVDLEINEKVEYRIRAIISGNISNGYITICKECDAVTDRGDLLIVIERSIAQPIAIELRQYMSNLRKEGWGVSIDTVDISDSPIEVKSQIKNWRDKQANAKSVVLIGHVPVPYSGLIYPDGHFDHRGAWPADIYYSEFETEWTDAQVNYSDSRLDRNDNVPGDGKFDQSLISNEIELSVGRIDLSRMTGSAMSEVILLRNYFKKNHAFRSGDLSVPKRGIISDNFKGYDFSASAWRAFPNFFSPTNIVETNNFFDELESSSYLWAYACGAGGFTSIQGVGTSSDYFTGSPKCVFLASFGSYFGDWDNNNNMLRAPLASTGYTLVNMWSGRPIWILNSMALGETIGHAHRISQHSANYMNYDRGTNSGRVHTALMGDPTLQMYPVSGPDSLKFSVANDALKLEWKASDDPDILGYQIYRSSALEGFRELLNNEPVTDLMYTISPPPMGSFVYRVHAIKLENTPSGSFYNLSPATFDSVNVDQRLVSVSLSLNQIELIEGDSVYLSGSISPANALNKQTSWSILDSEIVERTPEGYVRALKAGETQIVFQSDSDNSIQAICEVNVQPYVFPERIDISLAPAAIEPNQMVEPIVTFYPENVTNPDYKLSSSDPYVIEIMTNGQAITRGTGEAYLIAASSEGDVKDSLLVEVLPHTIPGRVEAENFSAKSGGATGEMHNNEEGRLFLGWLEETDRFDYQLDVEQSGYYKISYHHSGTYLGEAGFYIDGNRINSLSVNTTGSYKEWDTSESSHSMFLPEGHHMLRMVVGKFGWNLNWIEFSKVDIESISISNPFKTILVGEERPLSVSVSSETAPFLNKANWFSSSPEIATISADETIKGLKPGLVEITAVSLDGSAQAKMQLEVLPNTAPLSAEEMDKVSLIIYPNPIIGGILDLSNIDIPENSSLAIYYQSGKLVWATRKYSASQVTLSFNNEHSSGIYFLRIVSANHSQILKFAVH